MAKQEIVGGEPVSDDCPECGAIDKFYHCWPHCVYPTIVTCLKCRCPYKTHQRLEEMEASLASQRRQLGASC